MDAYPKVGRYELLEELERGGLGTLYRGHDTLLGREVAVKVMAAGFQGEETAKARFFREARAAAKLQHANIVTVFEFGEFEETPFIVMELLRGRSLAERLRETPAPTIREKLEIGIQLCAGLEAAHTQGSVHRDVKPENVWLGLDGSVKLLDFGLATAASSSATFVDVLANPGYLSPEQIAGRQVDGRADVFSVGAILYELLTGRRPFEGDSPAAIMLKVVNEPPAPIAGPDVPPALKAAVMRALEKSPDQRYARAGDLGRDLKTVRANLPAPLESGTMFLDPTVLHTRVERNASEETSILPQPAVTLVDRLRMLPPAALWGSSVALAVLLAILLYALWPSNPPAASRSNATAPPKPEVTSTVPPTTAPPATDVPKGPTLTALRLTSEPPGARIVLDGKDTGQTTPADLQIDPSRLPRIQLELAKFQAAPVDLTGDALRAGALHVPLSPRPAPPAVRLVATGDYPFDVVTRQKVLSADRQNHNVVVSGLRFVQLRADHYFLNQTIEVERTEPGTVRAEALPLGRITVYASGSLEVCKVLIDDLQVDAGSLPVVGRQIASGTHSVKLRCPGGETDPRPVTVLANQDVSTRFPSTTQLRGR